MAREGDTTTAEVVYLLAELRSGERGTVHEIGSRARVLEVDGDRLTLAFDGGGPADVATCTRAFVAREQRSLAARRRSLRTVLSSA